ncbi:hypothetical protein [Thermomicrobium sp.]
MTRFDGHAELVSDADLANERSAYLAKHCAGNFRIGMTLRRSIALEIPGSV